MAVSPPVEVAAARWTAGLVPAVVACGRGVAAAAAWLRALPGRLIRPVLLTAVGSGAAWLSFDALCDLAVRCGVPGERAWLLPVVLDAGAAVATIVARTQGASLARRRQALAGAQVLLGLSVAANAIDHSLIAMERRLDVWLGVLGVILLSAPPAVLAFVLHLIGPDLDAEDGTDQDGIDQPSTDRVPVPTPIDHGQPGRSVAARPAAVRVDVAVDEPRPTSAPAPRPAVTNEPGRIDQAGSTNQAGSTSRARSTNGPGSTNQPGPTRPRRLTSAPRKAARDPELVARVIELSRVTDDEGRPLSQEVIAQKAEVGRTTVRTILAKQESGNGN